MPFQNAVQERTLLLLIIQGGVTRLKMVVEVIRDTLGRIRDKE